VNAAVGSLSGGNQQKVVLSRWLTENPKIYILDEPTRGIDVGAKAEIYGLIKNLASAGASVLVISSELTEILKITDRVLIMKDGNLAGELETAGATEESILSIALGAQAS
jgi:ABC-type sugar transport system ATPase subunit